MQSKNKKGLLIIISGPSGVGKGTLLNLLMKENDLKIFYSVSMTTRPKRPGEENGREYYFVTREEFIKNIEQNNLLEWTEYVGNFYGTPKDKVEEMRNNGINVLLEIDVNGATKVLKENDDITSIYIAPPSVEDLIERLRHRGTETEDVIQSRVKRAYKELESEKDYKYIVINDDRYRAVNEIREIINKESEK